jgi:hypothetical protein
MTASDWKSLSVNEQEDIIGQWRSLYRRQETPLHPVVRELADEFKQIYAAHPQITSVRPGADIDSGGPSIVVSTLCDRDEPLDILPSDFHGIRVVQIPLANLRSAYVRTWTAILRQLLRWSEQKVTEWISRWSKELSGASGPFYHRPPIHYLAPTIVKEKLGIQIVGERLVDLSKEIERLLIRQSGREILYPADESGYDWRLAANELERFAERHGSDATPSNE